MRTFDKWWEENEDYVVKLFYESISVGFIETKKAQESSGNYIGNYSIDASLRVIAYSIWNSAIDECVEYIENLENG